MEELLAEHPEGVGRPITDRAAWEALGATKPYQAFVTEAEKLLTKPLPEATDDLYLDFSRTGNRNAWQGVAGQRHRRIKPLVIAECIENKGRFLAAIEQLVPALCSEKTWVLPAHDTKMVNFRGEQITIDLWSSAFAWDLATADWLLGEKLSPATRREIRENISRRVLEPFRTSAAAGGKGAAGWLGAKHNWNPVCLAGVIGSALQQIPSRHERAEFLAVAIRCSENYLEGYQDDGYCTEGMGYWNYGLGHYYLLAQMVRQATAGKIDLTDRPLVSEVARFSLKIQILNDVYPAFADCAVGVSPDHNLMYFANRRWNLGLSRYDQPVATGSLLPETMMYAFNAPTSTAPATASAPAPRLRDWFDKSGILVCRPPAGSACRMGTAIKGGHNAETHNHNDVGSYVIVIGKTPILLDPGSERYTARTFSAQRYESKVLNSFGHPVPVVAGQLQQVGATARAEILKTEFTDQTDRLAMQIRSAYAVPDLKSLIRTFAYGRQGQGSLTVTDEVEFSSLQSFGTALMTGGTCKQMGDGALLVQSANEAVRVTIDSGGEPLEVRIEEIKEDAQVKPLRIGLNLAHPVKGARITVTIQPGSPQ